MSKLLEEAIVDAAALRETAIKSAESALIEKYSREFKESVQKLLEQEEATPAPAGQDPLAAPTVSDPMAAAPMPMQSVGGKAFEAVPASFLDGDEDELITIDFDQLEKQIADAISGGSEMPTEPAIQDLEGGLEGAPESMTQPEATLSEELEFELDEMHDAGGHYEQGKDALYELEMQEEEENLELEEFELEEAAIDQVASAEAQVGKEQSDVGMAQKRLGDIKSKAAEEAAAEEAARIEASKKAGTARMEEDFSITEEELQELAEEMHVDLKPENQLRGQMGTTNIEKKLARNVELAAARDARAVKEREEEEKKLSDLKDKLEESVKENKKLFKFVQELKEHTEKLSVSNAKLLYTNKVYADASLNERQKQQIVENISKATTVLEAKTIYGALQSSVQGISERKPKESLSEALIRGSSPFVTRPKTSNYEDVMTDRMKILAGIKTKN